MSKRNIKLTEGDIENIVKKVIKEQGDLTGARKKFSKRDRKKYEQKGRSENWNQEVSGSLNFDVNQTNPLAVNVGEGNYDIRYITKLVGGGKAIPGKETPPDVVITIPTYDIAGSSLPYDDNMVMPYFDKFPDAQEQFRNIVETFKEYINAGGGDKLTNVTIKGSADSGTPTLQVPSGYSKLDHPSAKPYNGKTDPKEMNQYLANTRANQYARALINDIKEKTGFDLKINVLEGDNFYGQGDGKRGEEFRKITLEPNAEQHSVKNELKIDGKKTPGKNIKNESTKWMVPVYTDGVGKYREGYRVWDNYGNGTWYLALSVERADELGIDWAFDGVLDAKLTNSGFIVDGKLVGILGERPPMIGTRNPNPATDGPISYYSPKITTKSAVRTAVVDGEEIKVAYLKDIIFTFSNQRRG
tara:strand:- start:2308 stop:3552 length:1245 start_codon:yes stop_codon:yes gene_type:complete